MKRTATLCFPIALACLIAVLRLGPHALVAADEAPADDTAKGDAANDVLADARALLLSGKYAEAAEAYRALAQRHPADAAVGLARAQAAVGQVDEALGGLEKAATVLPTSAPLLAEMSRLEFERGAYDKATTAATEALKHDREQPLALWITAELHRVRGELDQAKEGYRQLVDTYNAKDETSFDALHWIGLAAAQHARWNRLSDQFGFLVNEFYPDALEREPAWWPAPYEAGRLFLEKYNQADAEREFKAALKLNANAAEVYAALATAALQNYDLEVAQSAVDRALEINPRLVEAHQAQADIHLSNLELGSALEALEKARALHALDESTLGRLAALFWTVDGPQAPAGNDRFSRLLGQVNQRNPHAGEFYAALADALDRLRRYPAAAQYYAEAIERMPQLASVRGQWGLVLMRLGDEWTARKLLDEAFEIDPFNVRVSNTLKVLEVLDGYETLETEHFRIRFDPAHDKILAQYAAAWLEEVYPQLCKQFDFAPPERSLFEIFNQAKNTDGHGWFSARMVGLPHVHTIGACAGKMVAMQSPTDGKHPFNWARVLKHEFIHVLNLQQTHFNIPHWYTEALAVLNEGYPRPQEWNDLLAERVPQGKIFNLDTINLGFIRAHSSAEWSLAYCQAELYAEYMLATYGDGALARLLAAYADNLSTRDALARAFQVDQETFERGYREHLDKIVAGLHGSGAGPQKSLAELERAVTADPKNADLLAQLAVAHLNRRSYPEARRLADAAHKITPRQPLAAYVRARLHLLIGETRLAHDLLVAALDEQAPQPNLLGLLAGLEFKAERYPEAARLYELGAQREPADTKWTKSLAAVYLKSGEKDKLARVLARLAETDADDGPVRKKLAELAADAMDPKAAIRWATDALHIDVLDPETHRVLAEALLSDTQATAAAKEYEVAVELAPQRPPLRFALAQAWLAADQPDKARAALEEVLKLDPKYPGAELLLEGLKP